MEANEIFRPACYHAQQSVEKSLKALLIDRNIEIPRTHSAALSVALTSPLVGF